jgi:hypothetical protein
MKDINGTHNNNSTSNDEFVQRSGLHLALCCCRQCRWICYLRVGQEAGERKAMACGRNRITFGSSTGWYPRCFSSMPCLSTQNSQAQLYESSASSCCSASCGAGLDCRKRPTMKISRQRTTAKYRYLQTRTCHRYYSIRERIWHICVLFWDAMR